MSFENAVEGGDSVSDGGGLFKVEFFGGLFHLGLHGREQVGVSAFEKVDDLIGDDFVVGFFD